MKSTTEGSPEAIRDAPFFAANIAFERQQSSLPHHKLYRSVITAEAVDERGHGSCVIALPRGGP